MRFLFVLMTVFLTACAGSGGGKTYPPPVSFAPSTSAASVAAPTHIVAAAPEMPATVEGAEVMADLAVAPAAPEDTVVYMAPPPPRPKPTGLDRTLHVLNVIGGAFDVYDEVKDW